MNINEIMNTNPKELERYFDNNVVVQYIKPPIAIRLDGVGFGKKLKGYNWPRDSRVHEALLKAAEALMMVFSSDYALVISDEINLVLLNYIPYSGRDFKIISIASSIASSIVSRDLNKDLFFDARIVKLNNDCMDIKRYLMYRVRVGFNNYHIEIAQSMNLLPRGKTPHINEVLRLVGNVRVDWETVGTGLMWSRVVLDGVNRKTGEPVRFTRRRITRVNPLDLMDNLCTNPKVSTLG